MSDAAIGFVAGWVVATLTIFGLLYLTGGI